MENIHRFCIALLPTLLPKQAVNEWPGLLAGRSSIPRVSNSTTSRAGDELAFAEEAPSEYGDDDVEDEDATSLNKVPSPKRLLKKHRRKRKNYKPMPVDRRPDEALIWDIEASPDDPSPMYIFAERLIARKQYNRANDYLERAYATAQRLVHQTERSQSKCQKHSQTRISRYVSNIKCHGTIRCRGANFTRNGFGCWSSPQSYQLICHVNGTLKAVCKAEAVY